MRGSLKGSMKHQRRVFGEYLAIFCKGTLWNCVASCPGFYVAQQACSRHQGVYGVRILGFGVFGV